MYACSAIVLDSLACAMFWPLILASFSLLQTCFRTLCRFFRTVLKCLYLVSFVLHAYCVVIFTSLVFLAFKNDLHELLACCSIILHAISTLKSLQSPSILHSSICFESGFELLVGLSVELRPSCLMV